MQPETMRLDGRVAVVIGGTGVLCGRIAETFAGAGARTVIVGRNAEKGGAVVTRITDLGGVARFASCEATARHVIDTCPPPKT